MQSGVVALQHAQIDITVDAYIDRLLHGKWHQTLRGKICPFTNDVHLFEVQHALRGGKTNRSFVAQLYVFNIGGKLGEVSGEIDLPEIAQRPLQMESACRGRVPGDVTL